MTAAAIANLRTFRFFAGGEPKGQPRPRAFAFNGKARMYDPGTAEGWKSCVAAAAHGNLPATALTGPVGLEVEFYFARPKSHYGTGRNAHALKPNAPHWCASKPDIDNAVKAIMDCCTTLGAWHDDAQVVTLIAAKRYADEMRTGAWITIRDLERTEA